MKRVYLSGPMTGLPDLNRPAFFEAATKLRKYGHEVMNPAELCGVDEAWTSAMRKDIRLLMDADCVVTLPGWEHSRGARLEVYVASQLEMPVYSISTFVRLCAHTIEDVGVRQLALDV
ncbi:uncharacterized protein DUF4406 [Alicyclobacillus sacchari]|uniref:Uncharacterized protein DUF4406 n=1 Tax=Alicyclobacillus sacchari TaxID=392010 RepID=A0A4R8LPC6_9BACL|nr:DUF4406 domain-containing protein [Alicyclobacillus sacchari]TDY46273.1 uncharacterized protein DUF4406 [Alicyclobacillus sacchari]GMA57230.1 hypothetical protein GCM10025858_17330 [Alicyclobacillus sacchari]